MMLKFSNNADAIDFYESLAHLFYAIAMSDGSMTREEKLKIIASVEQHWSVPIDTTNSKEIMYQTLRDLIANKQKSSRAFEIFQMYYSNHIAIFSEQLKHTIKEACDAIVSSFNKKNKSEIIMLTQLNLLFKKKLER
ncbi:hypothetical protein MTsPCn5_37960 [Croceitalea sp. MTPC5]|uniref:hypothetical protein n=1 Tax=Croceitalea sp. MTPC5 TaxID=3056565 RepID=UPI002B3C9111|nr:hypothetical protein MTsPCn5_37960 [Croceitalea sp. MTPC5]